MGLTRLDSQVAKICQNVEKCKFSNSNKRNFSDGYNNDDKNKATKGTKMYKICSVIKHGLQAEGRGTTPQLF